MLHAPSLSGGLLHIGTQLRGQAPVFLCIPEWGILPRSCLQSRVCFPVLPKCCIRLHLDTQICPSLPERRGSTERDGFMVQDIAPALDFLGIEGPLVESQKCSFRPDLDSDR